MLEVNCFVNVGKNHRRVENLSSDLEVDTSQA